MSEKESQSESKIHPLLKVLNEFDIQEVVNDNKVQKSYEEILFQYLNDLDNDFDKSEFIKRVTDLIHFWL